jgi:hypothetical protein
VSPPFNNLVANRFERIPGREAVGSDLDKNKARTSGKRREAVATVPPEVSSVLVGRPEPFRAGRNADNQLSAGAQMGCPPRERTVILLDVLKHFKCADDVETALVELLDSRVPHVTRAESPHSVSSYKKRLVIRFESKVFEFPG